ncbi:Alpha/Beta hydrolase protein [Dichotomocladium elegans]|nr:Alpha/Beta hydrolase protein [Dichotomocladium elegans]
MPPPIDSALKSFISISHPTFPEYAVRYTTPESDICDPSVKQYSGYLDESKNNKHFFFWFFESRNDPVNDPLLLWLNGGPGCSSLTGLFLELGPCQLSSSGDDTSFNPYAWNSNASIIFLDQPINVGYSYGESDVQDSIGAANDVNAFLQLFFSEFPEYRKLDFHIAGESYAGHYIPVIASRIARTLAPNTEEHAIRLKSILIGNGLTDPLVQYAYYHDMACERNNPILDSTTCNNMSVTLPECEARIRACYDNPDARTCVAAAAFCNESLLVPYYDTSGRSPYDIRKKCASVDDTLCDPRLGLLEKFLNQPALKSAVGSNKEIEYVNCNNRIGHMFRETGDWMRPYVHLIPSLLDQSNIKMLVYAGDKDFICNWRGNRAWTLALPWSGQMTYNAEEDKDWNGVGQLRTTQDGRLAFLRVYDAGHMVPEDQPMNSLTFLNAWLQNKLNHMDV